MSEKNKHDKETIEQEELLNNDEAEAAEAPETTDDIEHEPVDELSSLKAELEEKKKEYLFLMAEFDNFRKRTVKEKAELIKSASGQAMKELLPIVDDFERGLEATRECKDVAASREGMELIYSKLVKFMEQNGVKAMTTNGEVFDADSHEAIAQVPAQSEEQKGKIIDTVTKGYTINGKVLRHAKVVVAQ